MVSVSIRDLRLYPWEGVIGMLERPARTARMRLKVNSVTDAQSPLGAAEDSLVDAGPDFHQAFEGLRATGASGDMRDLVELLAHHDHEEAPLLAAYRSLATGTDGVVRYIIDLILEDECRHHRLLVEMATAMAWSGVGADSGPRTPALGLGVNPEVVRLTRKLRRSEQADRRALRAIHRRLRPFADETLWSLLVNLMEHDTEKHIAMLRFLECHAARVGPPPPEEGATPDESAIVS